MENAISLRRLAIQHPRHMSASKFAEHVQPWMQALYVARKAKGGIQAVLNVLAIECREQHEDDHDAEYKVVADEAEVYEARVKEFLKKVLE